MSDRHGGIRLANREAERMFGHERGALVGQSIERLMPDELREMHAQHRTYYMAAPRERRMGAGLDLVGLRRDGSEFPVEVGLSFVRVEGEPYVVSFISDITKRKELETERLRAAVDAQRQHGQESLGVLAGGVAHDFNNLLMCVLGNVELVSLELPRGSAASTCLQEIKTATQRGAEITSQILTYAGKSRFEFQPVDLSSLVRSMEPVMRFSVPRHIRVTTAASVDLPPVNGDPSQLRQVVMNLVTNAAESIGDLRGEIIVRTDLIMVNRDYLAQAYIGRDLPDGPAVSLEIADTGCGMDAALRARLFEPFMSTKAVGRGLGLAAVLGIVRSHGGAINVYSEKGVGSRIKIIFAPAQPASPPAPAATTDESGCNGRILVVEDEENLRNVTRCILERAGYSVWTAVDNMEAVERVRGELGDIDAVLLDMATPRMSGLEAFYAIRTLRPEIPVLFLSGYSGFRDRHPAAGDRRADFLEKPFETADLLGKLKRLMLL